jgi:DNA-binding transcriptional LysR family regulator
METPLRRLTLHQLRVFQAVVRHRNFTHAAAELRITQSAVSAQIRELTETLGMPLFEILGRKIHLTEAGRVLDSQAATIDGLVTDIAQSFAALRGEGVGSVRIGASSSIGTYFLPGLLASFSAANPRIELTLEIQNSALIAERIRRNEFDLGFIGTDTGFPEVSAEPFFDDRIIFACAPGHPLAGRTGVTPTQLTGERLILREPGSATRLTMERHLEQAGIAFPSTMQLGAVEAIKHAVAAGLGIAYFSSLTVRQELEEGRLAPIGLRGLAVSRTFFVVRHRRKIETPPLRAFLAFARGGRPAGA